MNSAMITGIVRHLLTLVGGYLISKMKLDPETIQAVIGAIATLVGCAWSLYVKVPEADDIKLVGNDGIALRPMTRRYKPETEDEFYSGEKFDIPKGIKPTQTNSGC